MFPSQNGNINVRLSDKTPRMDKTLPDYVRPSGACEETQINSELFEQNTPNAIQNMEQI